MIPCSCTSTHPTRRVVLTGGPGGGKTALLELVRQSFCRHVLVLPESAGIVFGGGFPRDIHLACQLAAQRAIYFVQRELETSAAAHEGAIVLCDRGTLDGLAYWRGNTEDFWSSVHSTESAELARYDAVIHLETPSAEGGYNRSNPLRTESPVEAAEIDRRILHVWRNHPRRFVVRSQAAFLDKCRAALELVSAELPECCRQHVIPDLSAHGAVAHAR